MKQNRLTKDQKERLFEMYRTYQYSYKDLAKYFNKSVSSIACLLNREGLKGKRIQNHARKYPINQTFFDEINSEEKAYFLGFLCADGCNHKNSTKISMFLKESDKEILEIFKNLLQPTKPLTFLKKTTGSDQYGIQISNRKISNRLNELGCVPNKTFNLLFPNKNQVPKEYLKYYLRGFFDGDGWLGEKESSITATNDFCETLQKFLFEEFSMESRIRSKGKISEICFSTKTTKFFTNWIYKDCTFFLKRKYQKYKKYHAS